MTKEPKTTAKAEPAKAAKEVTEDEIRDAITGVIDSFRGRVDKVMIVNVLQNEAELLYRGE